VIPNKDSPHQFSHGEIQQFVASVSASSRGTQSSNFENGDVVLVKSGYLKGLYGIIRDGKKCRVFFSFYTKQFDRKMPVTSLEVIGKVSGYEFPATVVGKPLVIGTHVVHHSKLHRETGRKRKSGRG
jgi:hypothetical protein